MRRHILLAALLALGVLPSWLPAFAQFYPGYGYYGWGGFTGAGALIGGDYNQSMLMAAQDQNRIQQQQAAQTQNYVVQSGIRNTLSSQAQERQNAILSRRQDSRDWWYQQQANKTAAMNAMYLSRSASAPTSGWGSYGAVGSGFGPSGAPPPADTDIIKWLPLLQEQCFASARAEIEAPYRRTPGKLSAPTEADYRQMARAVEDMKAILEWRLSEGVNTNEYEAAKAFLNKLGQEVARGIANGAAPTGG